MKRFLALFLICCMLLSVLSGCGSRAEAPETAAETETIIEAPETEPEAAFVGDGTPIMSEGDGSWKVHEDFSDGTWQLCEETDPLLVEVAILMSGFTECYFASEEKVSNVQYYVKDNKAAITFDFKSKSKPEPDRWELHAARSEEFINISGIPVGGGNTAMRHTETDGSGEGKLEKNWYETRAHETVVTAFAPGAGNVYSLYMGSIAGQLPNVLRGADLVRNATRGWPRYMSKMSDGMRMPPEKAYIGSFSIQLGNGGETRQYQYRFGMSLSQWINSEYNTDGFTFDRTDPTTIVSPDGKYDYPDVLFYGGIKMEKRSRDPYTEQCNRLLCYDTASDFQLIGARLTGTEKGDYYADKRVGRNWSNPGLGANDEVTIELVVPYENQLDGLTVFIAPHSDSTTELPGDAEEYAFTRGTVTADEKAFRFRIKNQPAACISYKTGEDGFNAWEGIDVYALYEGKVIYKLWLAKFW